MDVQYITNKLQISEKENDYLLMFDIQTEGYEVLSDVISLDLRGNYGMVLSGIKRIRDKKNELEIYHWKGNLFYLKIDVKMTQIENLYNSEVRIKISTDDFADALKKWKKEYLKQMGFEKFEKSKTLSHIYGILLLAYYMRGEVSIENSYNDRIKYAINGCAHRYGVSRSTLYSQCTRDVEIEGIDQFYKLSNNYLKNRDEKLMDYLEKNLKMKISKVSF